MTNYNTTKKTLPLDLMTMGTYQRAVNMTEVNKIVKSFDRQLMRPIDVSRRAGKYYVLDGQHRVAALRKMGKHVVSATVHLGMTEAEEAMFFVRNNDSATSTTASALETAHAKLIAGDKEANEIDEDVIIAGYEIDYEKAGIKRGIQKYPPLRAAYKRGNLIETLSIIHDSFGSDARSIQSQFITSVSKLLTSKYLNVDKNRLRKVLSRLGAKGFNEAVSREAMTSGATRQRATQVVISTAYNHALASDKKIPARW